MDVADRFGYDHLPKPLSNPGNSKPIDMESNIPKKPEMPQNISIDDEFSQNPEHFKWVADLFETWENYIGALDVVWNSDNKVPRNMIFGKTEYSLDYLTHVKPDKFAPELSNRIFCVKDGKSLSHYFGAPIVCSKNPLPLSSLDGYEIDRIFGGDCREPIDIASIFHDFDISEDTPVYPVVFFMPVPPEGANYDTNFFPMISSSVDTGNILIEEDNLVARGQICTHGDVRFIKNYGLDKDGNPERNGHYFKPKFTIEAEEEGKLILPTSEGRMIIISKPIEVKRNPIQYGVSDFRNVTFRDDSPLRYAVGTVSIEQGMKSNNSACEVETKPVEGRATIYDIRCIGIRREKELSPGVLRQLFKEAYKI